MVLVKVLEPSDSISCDVRNACCDGRFGQSATEGALDIREQTAATGQLLEFDRAAAVGIERLPKVVRVDGGIE